jgi:hypothetical protein
VYISVQGSAKEKIHLRLYIDGQRFGAHHILGAVSVGGYARPGSTFSS